MNLDWKLLDIRIGRANRLQFFTATFVCFLCSVAASLVFTPLILLILYMFALFSVRRTRDIGHSGWWATLSLSPYILLAYVILIAFVNSLVPTESSIAFSILILPALLFPLIFACAFLSFLYLAFMPGSLGPNKYGTVPKGLYFSSMVNTKDNSTQSSFHKRVEAERKTVSNQEMQA